MNVLRRLWYRRKYQDTPFASLFDAPDKGELVALDCETTSLDPKHAELVTIAAVRIRANQILTSQPLQLALHAPDTLDGVSVAIHRIRHQDLKQGLRDREAMEKLLDFIGNRPVVGYHIRYDMEILSRYSRRLFGFPLPNPLVEVSHMYQQRLERLLPNAYYDLSIEAITRHLKLPDSSRHDAWLMLFQRR